MDYFRNTSSTYELTVQDLCEQVDYYKELAEQYREKLEELEQEYWETINQNLRSAQQGVAQALCFALSASEGPDGSLVINSENRKRLAETYKNEISE